MAMIRDAFVSILESKAEPMLLRNLEGGVVLVNHAAREFFGHDDLRRHLPETEIQELKRICLETNAAVAPSSCRLSRRANGREVDVEIEVIPVRDEGGNLNGWIEAIRETSNPYPVGPSMLAMAVAHDLRSPLSTLSNLAYLMEHHFEQRYVDMMKKQLQLCQTIVNNFLEYSGKRRPRRKRINLNDLVRETISSMPLPSRVTLTIEDTGQAAVIGDPGQVRQVVMNLFQNALDALEGREGTISILLCELKDQVRLDIHDSGPGIETVHLSRVFQPFFSTKDHGFGLGLAASKQIVDAHRGKIEVESIQSGTTFSVYLPKE